jgi:curved DNA-binding protein CbpA
MAMKFSPYKVLGVGRQATEEQIKSRYRLLAKRHHPDHGGNQEKFLEAKRAYDVLMDPAKRKVYDEYGLTQDDPECAVQLSAINTLKTVFISILNQVPPDKLERLDLMGSMRDQVTKKRASIQAQLETLRAHRDQSAKTLAVMKKRLRQKKKKVPNLFVDALTQQLAGIPAQIAHLEREFILGAAMLEILEDFNFDFVRQQGAASFTWVTMQVA